MVTRSAREEKSAVIACTLSSLGPVGRIPAAPGTWGAMIGVCIGFVLNSSFPAWIWPPTLLTIIVLGQWSCRHAEQRWGSDPKQVVIDETAGQLVSLILIQPRIELYVASFLLFRAFDILKPWPIGKIDRAHGSWSVMGDDLLAGLLARAVILAWSII